MSTTAPPPPPPPPYNKSKGTPPGVRNCILNCNNCGKEGHVFSQCKMPITSLGIVVFRWLNQTTPQYLMICRKDTLGFIDFMRGKYHINNRDYIMNMFKQMTIYEKYKIANEPFDVIWAELWGDTLASKKYNLEERISRDKFTKLKKLGWLKDMVQESIDTHPLWEEAEWGFPKGRRNYSEEKDLACAVREFVEETGYTAAILKHYENLFPFEENFMGSNYKCYKHKYFLCFMDFYDSIKRQGPFQTEEVAQIKWKTYEECLDSIRPYNEEKKQTLAQIHHVVTQTDHCVL